MIRQLKCADVPIFCDPDQYDHGGATFDNHMHVSRYTLKLGTYKVSHPWGETLLRAIFANWLVGIATWQVGETQRERLKVTRSMIASLCHLCCLI